MNYPYEKVLERILGKGEEEGISDKEQGVRLGVSERVIRRVKQVESMDAFDADMLCTRGLGLHPAIVFGLEEWAPQDEAFLATLDAWADAADERSASKGKRRARKQAS